MMVGAQTVVSMVQSYRPIVKVQSQTNYKMDKYEQSLYCQLSDYGHLFEAVSNIYDWSQVEF